MPDAGPSSSLKVEPSQTQFVPQANDDETLWEVIEITAERGGLYKVRWAGIDPSTNKPWAQSWVPKHDCTNDLIRDWKAKKAKRAEKRKSAVKKPRGSAASSKATQRSASTSTTNTTRRTRQSIAHPLTPSTTTRPTPAASGSRASPSVPLGRTSPPRKRRRSVREKQSDDEIENAGPSRPRKKRKVEVEVVSPRGETSREPKSSYEVVAQRKHGKKAVSRIEEDVEEEEAVAPSHVQSKAGGKRKAGADETEERVKQERGATNNVPLTKVGPPRHLKRIRNSESNGPSPGHGDHSPEHPIHPNGTGQALPQSPRSHSGDGRSANNIAKSRSTSSLRHNLHEHSETEDSLDEAQAEASRQRKVMDATKPTAADMSLEARRALMQEEEENTQEAAGLFPPPELSDVPRSPPLIPQSAVTVPGPSRPAILRGRPSANDTLSRDGIVPETQTTGVSDLLDEPPYDPMQEDLNVIQESPSTPARPRQTSVPGSGFSVVSKMKSRTTKGKAKAFRPISDITPPDFRPYLPSTLVDDIEEFSSPERSARKRKPAVGPYTQDTIEDFTEDQYIDWDGGMSPNEPPMQTEEESQRVGPLPKFHHGQIGLELTLSPEIPLLQEPPPTSTTQQAEADSQSQDRSVHNAHIVELTAALEEKDEKLTHLEAQMGELQTHISELQSKNSEERLSFEAELRALQESSNNKSEQVYLLESQMVELQLQLTQLADSDNKRRAQVESEIRELKETLEEREEQLSQLESSLVELQTDIDTMQAENEKLAQTVQQPTTCDADILLQAEGLLAAAQQRVRDLEQELASTLAKLAQTEAEVSALTERMETTTRVWQPRIKSAEEDRDLFRKLFDDASTNAQRLAQENRALEERAQRAEGQVGEGLAMVRGTHEQQVQKLQKEVEKWKGLCQLLTEKDERTNDDVRRRAALMPTLQGENVRLRVDLNVARRESEKLKELLEDLASAPQQGTGQAGDDDDDEDFVPDPDAASSVDSSSDSRSRDTGSVLSSGSQEAPLRSQSPDDQELHVCQYVSGTDVCNATFPSAQEVIHHALESHWQEGQSVSIP